MCLISEAHHVIEYYMIIGNFYNHCKNRSWTVMLDVHGGMFIWGCHLRLHLLAYFMCVCITVYHVPGIEFRSLALVTIAFTHRAISPSLNVAALIVIFSSSIYLYLYLHFHMSNKDFLRGKSFMKQLPCTFKKRKKEFRS